MFAELILRQVRRQRCELAEGEKRLLLHEVARLHVGLAVERPVGLQSKETPRRSRHHSQKNSTETDVKLVNEAASLGWTVVDLSVCLCLSVCGSV